MKLLFIAAMTLASASALAGHNHTSGCHHKSSHHYSDLERGYSEVHWNDMTRSQDGLRKSGGRQRPFYQTCDEADFGSEFWWECRKNSPQ